MWVPHRYLLHVYYACLNNVDNEDVKEICGVISHHEELIQANCGALFSISFKVTILELTCIIYNTKPESL